MFMNVAYLNNSTSTVVDNTKPLIVTSCGNYRVKNRSEVVTHRPKGRKDYQLLYIASGKGHFFIHGEEKTVSAGNIIRQPLKTPIFKKRITHFSHFWAIISAKI